MFATSRTTMSPIALFIVLIAGVFAETPAQEVIAETPALEAIAETNSKFSRDFFKALRDVEGNMVSSPLSAHLVLSMTQLGAGGSTASQMSRALHLPADGTLAKTGFKDLTDKLQSENSEGVNIKIANRMFVKSGYDIKQEFVNATRDTFNSEPQSVDFVNPDTRNVINHWVEQQTNDKIKDLIKDGDLDPSTRVVLVNAVYFNGQWLDKFDPGSTYKRQFYTTETHSIDVPMMTNEYSYKYKIDNNLDAKIIELPYEGNKMSLVILLPNSRTGLSELENKMQTADLSSVINSTPKTLVKLIIPKFKIESETDLQEPLNKMGMGDIFENTADFSGISTSEPLKISKVVQKTIIQVAENGTEAASATYVSVVPVFALLNPPPTIVVDQPFLFYLVHRTTENNHVVLFSGRVVKPEGY